MRSLVRCDSVAVLGHAARTGEVFTTLTSLCGAQHPTHLFCSPLLLAPGGIVAQAQ
jgi:hypothetical protein